MILNIWGVYINTSLLYYFFHFLSRLFEVHAHDHPHMLLRIHCFYTFLTSLGCFLELTSSLKDSVRLKTIVNNVLNVINFLTFEITPSLFDIKREFRFLQLNFLLHFFFDLFEILICLLLRDRDIFWYCLLIFFNKLSDTLFLGEHFRISFPFTN